MGPEEDKPLPSCLSEPLSCHLQNKDVYSALACSYGVGATGSNSSNVGRGLAYYRNSVNDSNLVRAIGLTHCVLVIFSEAIVLTGKFILGGENLSS